MSYYFEFLRFYSEWTVYIKSNIQAYKLTGLGLQSYKELH
jgi:hypothetical protein